MPKEFEDDQVEELLERISNGEAITTICKDPRMPSRASVYSWVESDAEFSGRFRAARARGCHALAEECLEIADAPSRDAVAAADKRIRIDTRLRLIGKWSAKDYGDKIDVNYNAEVTHRHDRSGYSADELDALEKLIGKAANAGGDTSGTSAPEPGSVH